VDKYCLAGQVLLTASRASVRVFRAVRGKKSPSQPIHASKPERKFITTVRLYNKPPVFVTKSRAQTTKQEAPSAGLEGHKLENSGQKWKHFQRNVLGSTWKGHSFKRKRQNFANQR